MLKSWQRLEQDGLPIYLQAEKPDWVVASDQADLLLQELLAEPSPLASAAPDLALSPAKRLCARQGLAGQLATEQVAPYLGRQQYLSLNQLKECWFHLSDRCNLACRHCLFASSPASQPTLPRETLLRTIAEAKELGCKLFYFTGGEPLVYPNFSEILAKLLAVPEIHAVVLSNGLLVAEHLAELKKLPRQGLHLQISVDGLERRHEALRGRGTFSLLRANLELLRTEGFKVTIAMAVNRGNVSEMAEIVDFAGGLGVKSIHFLWHFIRGKGSRKQFVPAPEILPELLRAQKVAQSCGVLIDNIETLRAQVFSAPGTKYDLANTAWESLAVGPDACVYPSPALIGVAELNCGSLATGLARIWRESSVLTKIRRASLIDSPEYQANPLKFLVGGGDLDHSYLAGGAFVGHDPYLEIYKGLALWLIADQARQYPDRSRVDLRLRMGEVRHDHGCVDGGEVALTHCNCVISLAHEQGQGSIREFYARLAVTAQEDITNPFAPEQALANFIPEEAKRRSYGCGSPVQDAAPRPGEVLVDLGSGSGVECFQAAVAVGPKGRVLGIDMTDEMLALANEAKKTVVANLGYDNLEFKKGLLEDLPLADATADVVISNCVINLSPDKRRTFNQILRILKPGGRLVVSDVVSDGAIPVAIKNSRQLRGECLGGVLTQEDLLAMLRSTGFVGARLLKRFPYRLVEDTPFYSLTFSAWKPEVDQQAMTERQDHLPSAAQANSAQELTVSYRGPFAAVISESGVLLLKGQRARLPLLEARALAEAETPNESLFHLDQAGIVTNLGQEHSCLVPFPVAASKPLAGAPPAPVFLPSAPILPLAGGQERQSSSNHQRHGSGCMACGRELVYLKRAKDENCYYCGVLKKTDAVCNEGHFVCDGCHQQDGLKVIKAICAETSEQDLLTLLATIRSHPAVPLHGPEHHAMVPGIILATYRNRGGQLSQASVDAGIERGSKVPGGACGFWGNCGAAIGVGIAFSLLLEASPLTPSKRQQTMQVSAQVLAAIAAIRGARCCQRETFIALREAAKISQKLLPLTLLAAADYPCRQSALNQTCIGGLCPLWRKPLAKIKMAEALADV